MIVLDTDVVSELMRQSPAVAVREWVLAQDSTQLSTTAVTVAEVRFGLERMPAGGRRDLLRAMADEIFAGFEESILPFDRAAAIHYAVIVAARDGLGHAIDGFDAQIAAICRARGAALATRNLKDFQDIGVDLVNPWD